MRTLATALLVILVTAVQAADHEPYETLVEYDCLSHQISAYGWFGEHPNGFSLAGGARMAFEGVIHVTAMEFYFHWTGDGNQGIPSVIEGDHIRGAIRNAEGTILAHASALITTSTGRRWLSMELEDGPITLPAGTYDFCVYLDVPRQCGLGACNDIGDERAVSIRSSNGLAGPWVVFEGWDPAYRLHLTGGAVEVEATTWSVMKAGFR